MPRAWQNPILRYVATVVIVVLIVLFYRRGPHVNPTTVALTFLLAILIVSATWGLRYAFTMTVVATLLFNYLFLPPWANNVMI